MEDTDVTMWLRKTRMMKEKSCVLFPCSVLAHSQPSFKLPIQLFPKCEDSNHHYVAPTFQPALSKSIIIHMKTAKFASFIIHLFICMHNNINLAFKASPDLIISIQVSLRNYVLHLYSELGCNFLLAIKLYAFGSLYQQ